MHLKLKIHIKYSLTSQISLTHLFTSLNNITQTLNTHLLLSHTSLTYQTNLVISFTDLLTFSLANPPYQLSLLTQLTHSCHLITYLIFRHSLTYLPHSLILLSSITHLTHHCQSYRVKN